MKYFPSFGIPAGHHCNMTVTTPSCTSIVGTITIGGSSNSFYLPSTDRVPALPGRGAGEGEEREVKGEGRRREGDLFFSIESWMLECADDR